MDKEDPSSKQLPLEIVATLLRDAVQAQKQGSHTKARSLLRVLTIHHPEEIRAWLLLAMVAADRDEQRFALEQVIAYEPDHPLAKRVLATLQNTTPQKPSTDGVGAQTKSMSKVASFDSSATKPPAKADSLQTEEEQPVEKSFADTSVLPQVSEEANTTSTEKELSQESSVDIDTKVEPTRQQDKTPTEESFSEVTSTLPAEEHKDSVQSPAKEHQPDPAKSKTIGQSARPTIVTQFQEHLSHFRWLLYTILIIAVILFFLIILLQNTSSENNDSEQIDPTPPLPGARRAQTPLASNAQLEPTENSAIAIPLISTDGATPTRPPTAEPELNISTLTLGRPVQQDNWYLSLLREEDIVVIQEAIANREPDGQFLIVLMTINNSHADAMRIPTNLITLLDGNQNRYDALPQVSTIYLDTYGRGQYGDVSMEELMPPSGNVSVPLIFDIPKTADNFQLYMEGVEAAWPIDTSFIATAPTILPTVVLTSTITPTP
ncbi:MAG: hypothetical protein AAGF95_20520 [Chloroflexota bacterium]